MKKYLQALMFATVLFYSCSKEKQSKVWVRIENGTTETLSNARSHGVDFGTIEPGQVTVYRLIAEPIYSAGCSYLVKERTIYTGTFFCLTPMPPAFSEGHYTFIVRPTTQPFLFWTEVKKE